MKQKTILEQPQTMDEALRTLHLIRQENEFLKKQLEVVQTFQARMGLMLNKIKISDLFDKKILASKAQELSRTRLLHYDLARRYFSQWTATKGIEYADEINTDLTWEFWEWFKTAPGIMNPEEPLSEFTRIHIWQAIKATFQYAEDRDSIIKNPFKNKVFPLSPIDVWWDDAYYYDTIEAIRKYARSKVRHQYETTTRGIYTTGIRIALFLGVKNKDVIITEDGRVILKTRRKIRKTAKIQEFPIELMNEKTKEMYLEYYEPDKPDKYVLINGNSTPKSAANQYRRALKGDPKHNITGIYKKAEMPYKSPHKAKHGFITKMLNKGYSAVQICKMTGNSDPRLIETTYNHVKISDFKERVKADIKNL